VLRLLLQGLAEAEEQGLDSTVVVLVLVAEGEGVLVIPVAQETLEVRQAQQLLTALR
jgi:hypothetical protein